MALQDAQQEDNIRNQLDLYPIKEEEPYEILGHSYSQQPALREKVQQNQMIVQLKDKQQ